MILCGLGQEVNSANGTQTDIVFHELGSFLLEEVGKVFHEHGDFVFGTNPVFHREGVESQPGDVELATGFDNGADGVYPIAMAFDARKAALFCPATVAIHDDGNVFG